MSLVTRLMFIMFSEGIFECVRHVVQNGTTSTVKDTAFESAEYHREDAKSEQKERFSYFVSLLSLLLLRFRVLV